MGASDPWQVFGLRGTNRLIPPCVATSRLAPVSSCHARSPIPLRVSSGFSPDSRLPCDQDDQRLITIYGSQPRTRSLYRGVTNKTIPDGQVHIKKAPQGGQTRESNGQWLIIQGRIDGNIFLPSAV